MVFSFRAKMIAAIVALIAVPVIILAVLSYQKTEAILRESAQEQCLRTIGNARTLFIDSLVAEVNGSIELLAYDPRLKERTAPAGASFPLWDEYRRFHPSLTAVYFGAADGYMLLSSDHELARSPDPASRPWYRLAEENPGSTVWSGVYHDALTGRPVISASRAVLDGGKVSGVFGIDLSLAALDNVVEKIDFPHGGYAILVDQHGKVMAHRNGGYRERDISDQPWYRELKDRDEEVALVPLDGQEMYAGCVSVAQTGWKLIGFIPRAGIDRGLAPIKLQTAGIGVIAAIAAVLVGGLMMSRVAARLRNLVDAMARVGRGDLSVRWWDDSSVEFSELSRKFNAMVTTLENLIEQHQASQNQIALQKVYFEQLFENSPESVAIIDQHDRVVKVNSRFCRMFGYSLGEVEGRCLNDLVVPDGLKDEGARDSDCVFSNKVVEKETVRKRKDGELLDVFLLAYPIVVMGKLVGGYAIYRDISERKEADRKLLHASTHDLLTGAFNRDYFQQQMQCLEDGDYPAAGIIICDVDGLKLVNDTLGHAIGDEMLMLAARLLEDNLPAGAILCRIGGDEFAVLLPSADKAVLRTFVDNVKTSLEYANKANSEFPLSISLGYALRSDGNSMAGVYRDADSGMYREKLSSGTEARTALIKALTDSLRDRGYDGAARLQDIVEKMALAAGLPAKRIADLNLLAQFHDIGKVVVPDDILFKPGELSEAEKKVIRRHGETGYRIAVASPEFHHIADWILKHHERWDGGGYPLGLAGEAIPIECRILLIADAYDAMTRRRPYREAVSPAAAVGEIVAGRGRIFDPALVDIFVSLFNRGEVR